MQPLCCSAVVTLAASVWLGSDVLAVVVVVRFSLVSDIGSPSIVTGNTELESSSTPLSEQGDTLMETGDKSVVLVGTVTLMSMSGSEDVVHFLLPSSSHLHFFEGSSSRVVPGLGGDSDRRHPMGDPRGSLEVLRLASLSLVFNHGCSNPSFAVNLSLQNHQNICT